MKVDVKRFSRNDLLQDFKFVKNVVKIAMDVCGNNFLSPVVLSMIHHYLNNIFHEIKVIKKVITTETSTLTFTKKLIKSFIL